MKEGWSNRWKKLLIWISGYINIIAFAIVGGYTIVKSDDKELKKTSFKVFIITVIFTAIEAFLAIYTACLAMANTQTYSSSASDALVWMSSLTIIAKTIIFAVFAIIDFCNKGENTSEGNKTAQDLNGKPNEEKGDIKENSDDENDNFTKSTF